MKTQLLISPILSAITLTLSNCTKDEDCVTYTKRLTTLAGSKENSAGYACLQGKCSYVVSAGNLCRQSADCAQYSFLRNALLQNRTDLFPETVDLGNIEQYMEGICNPEACTIASSCEAVSLPFFDNRLPTTEKCCRGIQQGQPCVPAGVFVETCKESSSCIPDNVFESNRNICSVPSKQSTQWIGILLTLIGALITNMGLNLQKFALRKRHEKVVKKKERERLGLFYRLSSLKVSLSNFYKNMSSASLPGRKGSMNVADRERHLHTVTEETTSGGARPRSPGVDQSASRLSTLKSYTAPDVDKQQFQTSIGFRHLFKNPRWLLGMLVFTIGNFCNFTAFNFAAQSLLAPLGSFSLVCNVIIAPLLNGEVWSWKDVVGVILIIAGSTIVVIFAGFPPKDYNLCVLLKLFKQPATIVFLIVTCFFIGCLFFTILFVEKNLDLKEASAVVIEQTIEKGKLVDIQPNPHDGKDNDITITEEKTDTVIKRIVTIPSRPSMLKGDGEDDIEEDKDAIQLLDADGIPIEKFFKTPTGGSVHSLALTFELDRNEASIQPADETTDDSTSVVEETEKVVVLPRKNPLGKKQSRVLEFVKRWSLVRKLCAVQVIPRLRNPIALDSFVVRYVLPIAYASLGGLMGTLTVLFAKATIHLIEPTLFQGQNQFTSFEAYLFTLITLFTAGSQIYWINNGLARYDALIQIPVFYVMWTLFDVVGGGIYYEEFRGFSVHQFVLFCLGIVVIFCGVIVLAGRLKKLTEDDKKTV